MEAMLAQFHRVLVPVEFGAAPQGITEGENILWAGDRHVELAATTRASLELAASVAPGGRIRLVHATPALPNVDVYQGADRGVWLPVATAREIDDTAKKVSLDVLRALADRYCKGADVSFGVRAGTPADVILDEARELDADVIIVGASGRGRVQRFVLGSTADKLVRQAPCPVLVLPAPEED